MGLTSPLSMRSQARPAWERGKHLGKSLSGQLSPGWTRSQLGAKLLASDAGVAAGFQADRTRPSCTALGALLTSGLASPQDCWQSLPGLAVCRRQELGCRDGPRQLPGESELLCFVPHTAWLAHQTPGVSAFQALLWVHQGLKGTKSLPHGDHQYTTHDTSKGFTQFVER